MTVSAWYDQWISIHAPREGSDRLAARDPDLSGAISIHAPREGSDKAGVPINVAKELFQSTLPVRGATDGGQSGGHENGFQSTLPVRGATANISKMLRGILDRFSNF